MGDRSVQFTTELVRVLELPRRDWSEEDNTFAKALTERLALPGHTMILHSIQAQSLLEAHEMGGLFGPIRVGGGKTLLSLLLFYILGARRPLLLLPAKLIERTKPVMRQLAQEWPIPNFIRMMSYEGLGRVSQSDELNRYQPDVIVLDEAHKVKSPKAAVTKRLRRFLEECPETKVCALGGSMVNRRIPEYAHIMMWCLKPMQTPLPMSFTELEDWSDAIDEFPNRPIRYCQPGALSMLAGKAEGATLEEVRKGYLERLKTTKGVVMSTGQFLGASLTIEPLEFHPGPAIEEAFVQLRTLWELPDGRELGDYKIQVWNYARQLALGFWYKWDPAPPEEWMVARKNWAKACRYVLSHNQRHLDSPKQVADAIRAGHYPQLTPILDTWHNIEPTFEPNIVPVWIDNTALMHAQVWGRDEGGIIWVEHRAFGEALHELTSWPYFAGKGLDKQGNAIEQSNCKTIIASIASNSEGRNLQYKWHRNLITSVPPTNRMWEQLLGRTHRIGQKEDEVIADVFLSCQEHINTYAQARADAIYTQQTFGQEQKLAYADSIYPETSIGREGPRWF